MNGKVSLAGKTALVTGSSKGIGKTIAETFARSGAFVYLNGRTDEAKAVAEKFKEANLKASYIIGDATDEEFVARGVRQLVEDGKIPDILVNNVGWYKLTDIEMISIEEWDTCINTNLKSAFLWSREVVPLMKQNNFGRIINISSTTGIVGKEKCAHYSAAKGGLIGLTKGLAKELGPFGITVNVIAPGLTRTPGVEKLREKAFQDTIDKTPLGRLGTQENIANAALFLSSELSNFVTGQTLAVNGGFSTV